MFSRLWLAAALLVFAACNGESPASDGGPVEPRTLTILTPPGLDVGLRPSEQQTLRVRYTELSGAPLSQAPVRFAIFGDPRGSTLSTDTAFTDGQGVASIKIHAGAVDARFQVQTSAAGAETVTFYVEVSAAGFGAITISSDYKGYLPPATAAQLSSVTYFLYSSVGCGSFDPFNPPPSLRKRVTQKLSQTFVFDSLPLDQSHTLAAHAFRPMVDGSTQLRATGCVELPQGALRPCKGSGACPKEDQLKVTLLVTDVWPRVVASYEVTSRLTLPKTNRPLADALKAWVDMTDCPLDPEQRLLDCILDARDMDDPLDCKVEDPSASTQALLLERGELQSGCRGPKSGHGTKSLEQLLRDLAGTKGRLQLSDVEQLAAEALREIELETTLAIQSLATDSSGLIVASHQLRKVSFVTSQNAAAFDVPDVGVAKWLAAPIQGQVVSTLASGWDWELFLEQHSFSLLYGALAREALGQLVLGPKGLPPASKQLALHLAGLVQSKGQTGCAAIESVVCDAARLKPGCLGQACVDGLSALAGILDKGFKTIDSQNTDLSLEGTAQLKDSDGDLRVDGLGDTTTPGSWKATLSLGADVITPQQSVFTGQTGGR
jgi:hypothetical protein